MKIVRSIVYDETRVHRPSKVYQRITDTVKDELAEMNDEDANLFIGPNTNEIYQRKLKQQEVNRMREPINNAIDLALGFPIGTMK